MCVGIEGVQKSFTGFMHAFYHIEGEKGVCEPKKGRVLISKRSTSKNIPQVKNVFSVERVHQKRLNVHIGE